MNSANAIDLNRLAEGEAGEWAKLLRRFHGFMLKQAISIVKDIHSANDVVQEALSQLWRKKSQLCRIKSLPAYLARVTRNMAITHLRRLATDKMLSIHTEIAEPIESSRQSDPLATVCLDELCQTVSKARDELPPKQRRVVDCLLSDGGVSTRQVGRYIGCSHKNVQAILYRVRPKFKRADELLRR